MTHITMFLLTVFSLLSGHRALYGSISQASSATDGCQTTGMTYKINYRKHIYVAKVYKSLGGAGQEIRKPMK